MNESYNELFKRNLPIINNDTQLKIKNLRLLVAGCGSTGGAFIEGASRLGVLNFRLTEPDHFELHNLNRQFVYPENILQNKAQVHAERLQRLFHSCDARIEVESTGIQSHNIDALLENLDLVFDAVDVTTPGGMQAKLLLHEKAAEKKLLVLSALDLGFKQWLRIFDYRLGMPALDGRLQKGRDCVHPLKALVESICPVSEMPREISEELLRLLQNPGVSACQLAAPCHLLAAFSGPLLIRFVNEKTLPKTISFDLMRELETSDERTDNENRKALLHSEINQLLQNIK